jgi:hypothetical protein
LTNQAKKEFEMKEITKETTTEAKTTPVSDIDVGNKKTEQNKETEIQKNDRYDRLIIKY